MNDTPQHNEPDFETDHKYAIVAGWLIIPAISTLLTFLGSIIMLIFVNPFELTGFDLYIYLMDLFFFVFLVITYYFWFKRKKLFPKIIMLYFLINALWAIAYYVAGFSINFLNIAMSIVLIFYFQKSKRVEQTFIH